ncbi:tRNA(m5U54)methyltransferase, variant 2 [Entomophthora muscae]|uniref:tRNA(M5U54)methyltransferase, variant 2 n=1 Tax=Entomophthora muscae TaxID=34485 RepID=A0ACC2UPT1_9FUNG|nr:tRNA(m5U54)methyltransferase, variant 2 [Entomophthora muscae]
MLLCHLLLLAIKFEPKSILTASNWLNRLMLKHHRGYSEADLVEVIVAAKERRDVLPCKYAGTCGGCQWQHFDYEKQLSLKAEHLKRAFLYGSRPLLHMIPFDSPERSPLQTSYRTKLTPHFEIKKDQSSVPAIGFQIKGRRNILDIEECVLATPAVNEGYQKERERVAETYSRYPRGATLIIRESLADDESITTITNHKAQVTQKVGNIKFQYPSGSFFQINGSILPRLTEYVMDEIKSAPGLTQPPRFLLDVYCGSGLFTVACSSAFERVVGVDVSDQSISCAGQNATINGLTNCSFKLGNAEIIFDGLDFKGEDTAVIIDPPRKGCSQDFIRQLIEFGPSVIVYVSCNPFSQAQDLLQLLSLCGGAAAQEAIGSLPLNGSVLSHQEILDMAPDYVSPAEVVDEQKWESFSKTADKAFVSQYKKYLVPPPDSSAFTYRIVKAKPFDMFPQTKHIESLLTLVKVPIQQPLIE